MACYPGTPCNPVPVSATYPKKCNNGWFAGYPIQTNLICYNGPNLPNTGVNTGNDLNLVLEKIDLSPFLKSTSLFDPEIYLSIDFTSYL